MTELSSTTQNISLDAKTKKSLPGIPFVNKVGNNLNFYVNVRGDRISAQDNPSEDVFLEAATDYFIEHYFPELYVLVDDIDNDQFASYRGYYEGLRALIKSALLYETTTHNGASKTFKLYLEGRNIYDLRQEAIEDNELPPFEDALEYFNNERDTGETVNATSLEFLNQPSVLDELRGTISGFSTEISRWQGFTPPNLGFAQLGTGVQRIINRLFDIVYESDELRLAPPNFYDTDFVTLYFDSNSTIKSFDYFVLGANRSETKTAKIAFITNSKYNPIFQDELGLKVVENYEQIIEGSLQSTNLTQQQSIMGFFSTLGVEGSFTKPQIGDIPGSLTPGNNLFGNRSSDDLIDVSTYDELENTFNTIKTKEDLLQELQAAEDERVKTNILQNEKAKKLNAGIKVLDTIDSILNFNISLGGPNATKEQKAVNQILNQFGIQAMAKEIIICFTLGLGATASRITQAVRNSIVQTGASLRMEPTPPSKEMDIKRPNLKKFLEIPKTFSVTGDIHLIIKDIILSALANGAFGVIKSLAELVRFSCDALLRGETGAVDVGDRLRRANDQAALTFPNLNDLLAAEFAAAGLTLEDLYGYFSDVSTILDPIEVCRLLNSQREVEPTTYNNILTYNSTYSLEGIRRNMNTIAAVNSFFEKMSQYVDTVTLCNDIINNHVVQIVENCEICLSDDLFDANPALQELIDIAENGVIVKPPPIELLCPDSPNYLDNPIASTILPNLFNNILDTTKIYMAGSIEGARTSLLEPTVTNDVNSEVAGAFEATGTELPASEINTGPLAFITNMFEFFSDATQITNAANSGAVVCQDIDNAKLQQVVDNIDIVVDAISAALEEVPGVVEEINDKITNLQDQASGSGAAHTEYRFPEAFRKRFADAILTSAEDASGNGYADGIANSDLDWSSTSGYTTFQYELIFSGSQHMSINYPAWTPDAPTYLSVDYNLSTFDTALQGTLDNLVPAAASTLPSDISYQDLNINPYVYRFVSPALAANGDTVSNASDITIGSSIQISYAETYTYLYQGVFDYIMENGAFSADKINNLKFFKNNDNCNPLDVGDLFDTAGILDQMKREFAAAACYDQGSAKDKARNAVYYGLILMLIQTAIDEFIIKNIVVFSAFKMESIWELPLVRDLIINEVVKAVMAATLDGDPIFERELYNYFDRAAQRQSTLNNGGIVHTYPPYAIPPGFELNDAGTVANFPLDITSQIRFLVEERMYYKWDNGQRSTIRAINNILDPHGENASFDDVFMESFLYLGTYNPNTTAVFELPPVPLPNGNYAVVWRGFQADGLPDQYHNIPANSVFFEIPAAEVDALFASGLFDATSPSWASGFNARKQALFDLVRSTPDFQYFKTQVFNQDALLLGPVLYNFYLTNLFFSDISDSFNSTKRAILNFMNMTDASTRPPAPALPNNEFVNTLANNGQQSMDSLAREIFLTFLKETPPAILKGLVELIDPHIAISKIIREATGMAFVEVSKAMTTAINQMPDDSPLRAGNINGEDILALLFCIYNIGNSTVAGLAIPAGPAADAEANLLFGPRITLDGVDFKGTVAGMFMAPPSPLGVLYLLIELLKIKLEEDLSGGGVEDATEPPPAEEC